MRSCSGEGTDQMAWRGDSDVIADFVSWQAIVVTIFHKKCVNISRGLSIPASESRKSHRRIITRMMCLFCSFACFGSFVQMSFDGTPSGNLYITEMCLYQWD